MKDIILESLAEARGGDYRYQKSEQKPPFDEVGRVPVPARYPRGKGKNDPASSTFQPGGGMGGILPCLLAKKGKGGEKNQKKVRPDTTNWVGGSAKNIWGGGEGVGGSTFEKPDREQKKGARVRNLPSRQGNIQKRSPLWENTTPPVKGCGRGHQEGIDCRGEQKGKKKSCHWGVQKLSGVHSLVVAKGRVKGEMARTPLQPTGPQGKQGKACALTLDIGKRVGIRRGNRGGTQHSR